MSQSKQAKTKQITQKKKNNVSSKSSKTSNSRVPRVGSARSRPVTANQRSTPSVVTQRRRGRGGGMGSVPQPANRTVRLTFMGRQAITATSSNFWAYPIRTNAAFAPDASGSALYSTTPGFSAISAFYSMYRVTKYKYRIMYGCTGAAAPVEVFVCNSNSALGVTTGGSAVDLTQYTALRKTTSQWGTVIGNSGGPAIKTFTGRHTIRQVYGDSPFTDPGFKSATNTVPSILTYLVFGFAAAPSVTGLDLTFEYELDMCVEFLDYIDTITSLSEDGRPKMFSRLPKYFMCAGCDRLFFPWEGDHVEDPWERCCCGKSFICSSCDTVIPCGNWYQVPDCTRPPSAVIPLPARAQALTTVPCKPVPPFGMWTREQSVKVEEVPVDLSIGSPVVIPCLRSSPSVRRSHGPLEEGVYTPSQ